MAARAAAEKVRRNRRALPFCTDVFSGTPHGTSSSARGKKDLRTESDGEGGRRSVVVYPENYKSTAKPETAHIFVSKLQPFVRQLFSRHLTAGKNRSFIKRFARKIFSKRSRRGKIFYASMPFVSLVNFVKATGRRESGSCSAVKKNS